MKRKNINNLGVHPLRDELKRAGITQIAIANYLKVSFQTFWRWLNGYASMPQNIEEKLYALLKKIKIEYARNIPFNSPRYKRQG